MTWLDCIPGACSLISILTLNEPSGAFGWDHIVLSLVLWQVGVSARPMYRYSGSVGVYTLFLDRSTLWTQPHLRWHPSRDIWLLRELLIPCILLGTSPR